MLSGTCYARCSRYKRHVFFGIFAHIAHEYWKYIEHTYIHNIWKINNLFNRFKDYKLAIHHSEFK